MGSHIGTLQTEVYKLRQSKLQVSLFPGDYQQPPCLFFFFSSPPFFSPRPNRLFCFFFFCQAPGQVFLHTKLHGRNAPLWKEKHVIPGTGEAGGVGRGGGNAQAPAEAKDRGAARDEAPVTPRPGACEELGGSAVPAEAGRG